MLERRDAGKAGTLERRRIEVLQHLLGDEAAASAVDMALALPRLARQMELERRDERQIVLRASERNVQQAPLLLDELRLARREFRRETAVDDVEYVNRIPLHSFRGVDGREDEVVLIEQRLAREVAGGMRRIERELREKALAGGILAGQQLELIQVAQARVEVLVGALEVRPVPLAHEA